MNESLLSAAAAKIPEGGPPSQFYIPATESLSELSTRTLKHGDTFGIFDRYGDIIPRLGSPEGLYHNDTRYLSCLRLLVNGMRPLYLSSKVEDNNAALTVDLANPDLVESGRFTLQRDVVHIVRYKFLWQGACYEHLGLRNYDNKDFQIDLAILFAADFADIFEVRGQNRAQHGKRRFQHSTERATISYEGLDGVLRRTILSFDPPPAKLRDDKVLYRLSLANGGCASSGLPGHP